MPPWCVSSSSSLPPRSPTAIGNPTAQVMAQYNNFLKNLALFGGTLVLFVTGAGRFSVDRMLSKKD